MFTASPAYSLTYSPTRAALMADWMQRCSNATGDNPSAAFLPTEGDHATAMNGPVQIKRVRGYFAHVILYRSKTIGTL